MKKLVILAVASSALIAGTAQAALQHGFEVGARAGYMWHSNDNLNVNGQFNAATGGPTLNYTKDMHDSGALGGLFVGYNWLCNELLLGMDLSADWMDSSDRQDFLAQNSAGAYFLNSAQFDREFTYGVSGRIGYKAYDFMTPFLRLGIERVNNKLRYDLDSTTAVPVRQLGFADSTHKTGYLAGLGIDIPVFNKNTNVRIEYQYHWQNWARFDFVNATGSNPTFVGAADIKPSAHLLTIGLLWSQI